ncbi:SAVED domain-containing protein [Exiguobacterium sp. S3]|uniref:SAVED domain-containing protein n=1 Tax=Exiguobacterium sp. S3 TaxID=483245 RepID=UPI001BEBA4CD|nr:SAVED domain-containing protein [Exiguobacterium sp. S3]
MGFGSFIVNSIIVIVFIVGMVFTIKFFFANKKEQSISTVLITSGLSLTVSSFGNTWTNINRLFATIILSGSPNDAIEINSAFSQTQWVQLIVGIVLMVAGGYLLYFAKNKLFILNINAYYDKRIESNNKDIGLSTFEFKEREIDLVRNYKNGITANTIKEVVEIIEEKTRSFRLESKGFKRGYTGIAPIPFVMLTGTYLQREKINEYFEFDRIQTEEFYKLKNRKKYPALQIDKSLNEINANAEEFVIAVSLTKRITQEQMKQFKNAEKVELYLKNPKDNAIRHKTQLFEYAQKIGEIIEEISASTSCKKVHLLISSQSSLALEIGKRIDNQRMAEITCYFFDIKQDTNYPWGIIMNGENKGEFIER